MGEGGATFSMGQEMSPKNGSGGQKKSVGGFKKTYLVEWLKVKKK